MVLRIVFDYYGGPGAIFVRPADLFRPYHLLGFFNQQLLACPALPMLLILLLLSSRSRAPATAFDGQAAGEAQEDEPAGSRVGDLLLSFTGASSLTLLLFFFFLRPVIGPAADWDLFALPSLFYTPWLTLRVHASRPGKKDFPALAWSAMVLAAISVGPWISINSRESSQLARFRDLLEWEAPHNTWAASYGYLRLGKFLSRNPWDRDNPEIEQSLERAVEINPDSATLRLQVAQAYQIMGRPEAAKPQMIEHHLLLARYEEGKGNFSEAARQYREALELGPDGREILEALIRLYEGPLADPQRAEQYREMIRPQESPERER